LNSGIAAPCDLGCAEVEADLVSAALIGGGTGDNGDTGTKFLSGSRSLLLKKLKREAESPLDFVPHLVLAGVSAFPKLRRLLSLLPMVLGIGSNFPKFHGSSKINPSKEALLQLPYRSKCQKLALVSSLLEPGPVL
jgi:hypothetical protein